MREPVVGEGGSRTRSISSMACRMQNRKRIMTILFSVKKCPVNLKNESNLSHRMSLADICK